MSDDIYCNSAKADRPHELVPIRDVAGEEISGYSGSCEEVLRLTGRR